ncbi:hypothetical protein D1007_17446 [Hordeum vulgare]|nr:hypothetical protein D1007_17446 [Hordeum vulgare]
MEVRMVGSLTGTIAARIALPLGRVAARDDAAGGSGALAVDDDGRAPIRKWKLYAPPACPEDLMVTRGSCQAKAPRFVADDGDACGRHYLLEDVVMVLLSVSEFR